MTNIPGLGELANVVVEVDLFSGRDNPAFELSPPQFDQLRSHLSELGTPTARPHDDPGLGYRGFTLICEVAGGEAEIGVSAGVVEIRSPGSATARFIDDGGRLESWLINLAIQRSSEPSVRMLMQELRRKRGGSNQ